MSLPCRKKAHRRDALRGLVARQPKAQRRRNTRRALGDDLVKRAVEQLHHHHEGAVDAARAKELADARVAHARQQVCLPQERLLLGSIRHGLYRHGNAKPGARVHGAHPTTLQLAAEFYV
eukprot:scaffold72742_cov60-Phaeocystis_antarctica.AAC.4